MAEIEPADFERVIEVNLIGTWPTVHATLPELRRRRGYLLIVTSMSALGQGPYTASYNASKAGLVAFANTLRLEERGQGLGVGAIYFNAIDTKHARRSMGHPLMVQAFSRLPRAFLRPAPVEAAAAGMEREIVVPSSAGFMLNLPRLAQRLAQRFFTTRAD